MVRSIPLALVLLAGLPAAAHAIGGSSDRPAAETRASVANPEYGLGKRAVDAGRYQEAIGHLEKAIAIDPGNADALNLLAYSHRNLGHLSEAEVLYFKALAIDPDHRGALEYLGELYLKMGNVAQAEAQLAKLDRLCTFGCPEYAELKAAIENHRAGK